MKIDQLDAATRDAVSDETVVKDQDAYDPTIWLESGVFGCRAQVGGLRLLKDFEAGADTRHRVSNVSVAIVRNFGSGVWVNLDLRIFGRYRRAKMSELLWVSGRAGIKTFSLE